MAWSAPPRRSCFLHVSRARGGARVKFGRAGPKGRAHVRIAVPPLTVAAPTIATAELQVGMFVHLDLGWMSHPFALSSFRIANASEIATIRSLGLARVRWSPEHSEPELVATLTGQATAAAAAPGAVDAQPAAETPRPSVAKLDGAAGGPRSVAQQQRDAAEQVQRQYAEASRDWRAAARLAHSD